MRTVEIIIGVCVVFFATVKGFVTCGKTECFGSGAYCCENDFSECCWKQFHVYTYWWFWFIWFWVIFFGVLICLCVRRRRQLFMQPRYVVVEGQQTYGAMPPARFQQAAYNHGYTATVSAPAYQVKPPEYSTVANR